MDTGFLNLPSPFFIQFIIGYERVDIRPFTQTSQAGSAKFGTIRYDNRPIGTLHHCPLGFNQKHVAVVKTSYVDTGNTQKSLLDVDRLEHLICKTAQRYAGPVMESAT